jgi:D-2-hydroxyacid dehydrogenase (NADP+)
MLPEPQDTLIQFAHPAYKLHERFAATDSPAQGQQAWTRETFGQDIRDAHVVVASGFWDNALLDQAPNLKFIQMCAAGYDNVDVDAVAARGIRLCNASGVNAIAVTEHALSLILALQRQVHVARDNQSARVWRPMISEIGAREEELAGKTVLVYGAGAIGSRLARICRAFEAHTIGIKRTLSTPNPDFDEMFTSENFVDQLSRADIVVLTCPLTDATRNVINAEALLKMRSDAYLINVARGGCVDAQALVTALQSGQIAGAGIDVTPTEPLEDNSALWSLPNVILTPHTGGETRAYEDRVAAILNDNLGRLWADKSSLYNQIV